jgi:hypothetical protein
MSLAASAHERAALGKESRSGARRDQRMQLHRLAGLVSGIIVASSVITSVEGEAHASDTAPKTTLYDLALDGNRFVAAAMSGSAPSGRDASVTANADPTAPPAEPPPLFDILPRASLVARDWRGSMKVAGRTMLIDDLRPAASHRMVFARIASDARLSPYAQVGGGEWRVDPVLFPQMPMRQAFAGAIGAGLELRTNTGLQIAGEADYTFFYRPGPIAADDPGPGPRLLTVLFAVKTSW